MTPACCRDLKQGRTALTRSVPIPAKVAFQRGVIRPGVSVFDYGEGYGGLCGELQKWGIECDGWDPVWSPQKQRKPADVVMLNFVLSVICDPVKRNRALRHAFDLTRRTLVIGLPPRRAKHKWSDRARCGDGWLVGPEGGRRFHKFYRVREAQDYVESVLGRATRVLRKDPVVLAVDTGWGSTDPGIQSYGSVGGR